VDAPAIRELTRASYAKWVPLIGREPKPMGSDYSDYVAAVQSHLIDLVYENQALAGLIEMRPEDDHLLIENVAVDPRFQRRGIGKTLISHAKEVALLNGFLEVRLYTNKLFAENIDLYLKLGYRVEREDAATSTTNTIHMSKRL